MSDKPSSLRDRIAAFENANNKSASPPPLPRSKPSTLQSWKPKPPHSPENDRKINPIATSDAVESIGRAVSLKERMAALQGKGAFGPIPPPPILPKHLDKQRSKTLSQDQLDLPSPDAPIHLQGSPPATALQFHPLNPEPEGEHEAHQDLPESEIDPHEETRQRRAAIAARMARLGGARVGMGPPMFTPKPPPKKSLSPPPESNIEQEQIISKPVSPPPDVTSPSPQSATFVKQDSLDSNQFSPLTRKDSDSSSFSNADTAPNRSMPIPAGPRRAAPPRKKAYKSTPPSQIVPPSQSPAESVPESSTIPDLAPSTPKVPSHDIVQSPQQVPLHPSQESLVIADVEKEIDHIDLSAELDEREDEEHLDLEEPPHQQPEQEEEEEEDDDDEERRRRVAAKLSQMGAFNPLAGPPPVTTDDPLDVEDELNVDLEEVPPPPPAHVEEEYKNAEEAREADESASRAAESDDEPLPDLGTTRRVLCYDEVDEQERCEDDTDQLGSRHGLNEHEGEPALQSASEPHALDAVDYTPSPPPSPPPQNPTYQDQDTASLDAVDSPPSDQVQQDPSQELNPDQDEDEMAPARITRPIPPPPVNLSSKPSIAPPRAPLHVFQAEEEERPQSPAPRPVPPPVKSVKAAEVESRASLRRASASLSASVRSMNLEEAPLMPPVLESPHPPARRPISPPIITSLQPTHPEGDVEPQPQIVQEPEGEDEEAARRRTIAERMSRLGAIRFGAPPVPTSLTRPTLSDDSKVDTKESPDQEAMETEEDEAARKQRIAAKLASMGGMRFGMMPPGAGVAPATLRRLASKQDDGENEDAVPVPAPIPPARRPSAPPADVDSEQEQSQGTSDDVVRVELEDSESEIEEVYYSDGGDEKGPPPQRSPVTPRSAIPLPTPPPRVTSRSSPAVGVGRPPIPSIPTLFNRRPSVKAGSAPSSRKSSVDYSTSGETPTQKQRVPPPFENESASSPQSEYVMVEPGSATEEEPPVVPPVRRPSRVPPRSVPPPPPTGIDPPEEMGNSAQWELASIPQAASESCDDDEDDEDLASSGFSQDSTFQGSSTSPSTRASKSKSQSQSHSYSKSQSKSKSQSRQQASAREPQVRLSADELMVVWGKIGVQVVDAAMGLYEKSKRALVGDGSYAGFVRAVLGQVPDARCVSGEGEGVGVGVGEGEGEEDWGYLIYAQTGGSVQRRVVEILPGDVIAFWDAKLKGHKGLHAYSQNVGIIGGENEGAVPLVGVVSEVEGKKSKIRVWQANQHVGQQTVENVSYRLEDLKSGHVKVFRVMEA